MLTIKNLHAQVDAKEILRGLDLEINAGEVHAIMGPNGSGKSTLAGVLAGKEAYDVTAGEVLFEGKDLLELNPEERAREGVFLAFQYPVEIPGVTNNYFLRASVNAIRKHKGLPELDAAGFLKLVREKLKVLHMPDDLMEPKLCILDETDSGLDIDALKTVAEGVNALRSKDRAVLVITHYQRLLEHIVPDFVHVLYDGRIVKSGGKELALELEREGYDPIKLGVRQEALAGV
jgi:Fe-S cluster assembly ATP-binding protein